MPADLSLVSIDDLVKEIESRCDCFISAYQLPNEKGSKALFQYGKGDWFQSCHLANILNNDVLNNWAGELKTIQRINEEGIL